VPYRERISKETRQFIFRRDGYRCHLCGGIGRPYTLTADHVVPVAHGGTSLISNLKTAHRLCNSKRGARKLVQAAPTASQPAGALR
jgi:5-methylcytosine-specific restriction protein A